jgi:hypothetical protein
MYTGRTTNTMLAFSSNNSATVQLAAGNAILFVRVIDNYGGVTTSYLSTPVVVTVNQTALTEIMASLVSNNTSNNVVTVLQAGQLNQTSQLITAIAATMNSVSVTTTANTSSNGSLSNSSTEVLNQRVAVRSLFVGYLIALPLTDLSSLKLIASCLSTVTNEPGENSITSAVSSMNKICQMIEMLQGLLMKEGSVNDVVNLYVSIQNIATNLLAVCNLFFFRVKI